MTDCGKDLVGGVGCTHWGSPLDVVAIRFRCCGNTYPCLQCHAECEDHPVAPWPSGEWATDAVLCRVCGHWMTVGQYLGVLKGTPEQPEQPDEPHCPHCPHCRAQFNPGCARHAHIYFDIA